MSAPSLDTDPLPAMPTPPITLDTLRRFAVARSLFAPTKLAAAIERLGFVQADPIRAPARAQDLILRHRVKGYLAGDLERRYGALDVEEEFFVNYGFLPRRTYALLHPRRPRSAWSREREAQAEAVLVFVRARGVVHPREVDAHFSHRRVRKGFEQSFVAHTSISEKVLLSRSLISFSYDYLEFDEGVGRHEGHTGQSRSMHCETGLDGCVGA